MAAADEGQAVPIEVPHTHDGRPRRSVPAGVIAVIAIGGTLGASARYAIEHAMPRTPAEFPWATFLINVGGSFVLGLFVVVSLERLPPNRYLRPFVATGVLGGFTTFSTFGVESILLVDAGHAVIAVAYGAASLVVGLLAAAAGLGLGRRLPPRWRHGAAGP